MLYGLCVDPLNPAGRPVPANIAGYGFTAVRSVFQDHPDWYSYFNAARRVGLKSIVTLGSESFTHPSRADTIARLPILCDYVVIGNEPDGQPPSSWVMSQAEFLALIQECAPLIRQRCLAVVVVAGGLCSGQPGWLDSIVDALVSVVDAVDIHPYAKNPDEAQNLLQQYQRKLHEIPLVVLEWNRPVDQINDFVRMLDQETVGAAWFAYSDGMVENFGLVDRQGNPKPELAAMQAALGAQPPITPTPPQPTPVPPSTFSVGPDMLKLMAAAGDEPAADELYFKNPAGRDMWSEAMAKSGRLYRYVFSTDTTYAYQPRRDDA